MTSHFPSDSVGPATLVTPGGGITLYTPPARITPAQITAAGKTAYYVSNSGSNAAAGTSPATAWQTVAKVNASAFNPGDGIFFNQNQTFSDAVLSPSTAGTSGNPITYGTYSSLLDADRATLSLGVLVPAARSYITFDGLISKNVLGAASGTAKNMIVTQNCKLGGFSTEYGHECGNAADSNWQFKNTEVFDTRDTGIINWGTALLVEGCVIHQTGTMFADPAYNFGLHGIYSKSPNAIVQFNEIYDVRDPDGQCVTTRFRNILIQGNYFHDAFEGVGFYNDDATAPGAGRTSTIRYNRMERVQNGILIDPNGNTVAGMPENWLIYNNTIVTAPFTGAGSTYSTPLRYYNNGASSNKGTLLRVHNNIFVVGSTVSNFAILDIETSPALATYSETNNLQRFGTGSSFFSQWNLTGASSLAAWQTASGGGASDITTDPLLGSFAITGPTSPTINAGTASIPGVTFVLAPNQQPLSYSGTAPDIGATEFVPSGTRALTFDETTVGVSGVLDTFATGSGGNVSARAGWGSGSYWGEATHVVGVGVMQVATIGAWHANYWNTSFTDQESWGIIGAVGVGQRWVFSTRVTPSATPTDYELDVQPTRVWSLDKYISGAVTNLATGTMPTYNAGDAFKLRSVGTQHQVWYKPSGGVWELQRVVTDASIASGMPGIQGNASTTAGSLTDFGGGATTTLGAGIGTSTFLLNTQHAAGGPQRALTLTSTGTSTSTFTLSQLRALNFTSTGSGTSTFNLTGGVASHLRALTFTSNGVGTSTFNLVSHKRPLTLTSAGVGTSSFILSPKILSQITAVAAPLYPATVLGCGDARAEIWTRGIFGKMILDLPNITAVEYNRVRSDTSIGQVTIDGMAIAADPQCCAVVDTIRPWKHELHIYRDNALAWLGPINEIVLDGPSLQIKARDVSSWLDHRFIHFTHQWGGTQANQGSENSDNVMLAISVDGMSTETSVTGISGNLFFFTDYFGARSLDLVQRTYTPAQFKLVGPEIRDLAKGTLDWTIIGRYGYINPATWTQVLPNPVTNPTFESGTSGWTGLTADFSVNHSGSASGRTGAPPNVTGSITGLTVGQRYQLRCWMRGTSSTLDALQKSNDDGVIRVGNDESSVFSWYVYGQPLVSPNADRGRAQWIQVGVFFTATAATMPITITATGAPIDSHGIYFDDFELWKPQTNFTLRDYSLAEPPKITLSGLDQVNRAVVANQQSGGDYAFYKESPKPNWVLGSGFPPGGAGVYTADQNEFGLLEGLYTQPLSDSANAQTSATQKAASLGSTPIAIDKIILSPNAGVTMAQLIPGILFTLRLDEPCFAIQSDLVLQSVTVKTTPQAGETVELGFEPAGF